MQVSLQHPVVLRCMTGKVSRCCRYRTCSEHLWITRSAQNIYSCQEFVAFRTVDWVHGAPGSQLLAHTSRRQPIIGLYHTRRLRPEVVVPLLVLRSS
jgi:hypothetical protein